MIEVDVLITMVRKHWQAERDIIPKTPPPEAKYKTGDMATDAHLHYLATVYGIELHLSEGRQQIKGFEVIDEEKFVWFTLRWL